MDVPTAERLGDIKRSGILNDSEYNAEQATIKSQASNYQRFVVNPAVPNDTSL
jgi:hypothetical protein